MASQRWRPMAQSGQVSVPGHPRCEERAEKLRHGLGMSCETSLVLICGMVMVPVPITNTDMEAGPVVVILTGSAEGEAVCLITCLATLHLRGIPMMSDCPHQHLCSLVAIHVAAAPASSLVRW